MPTYFYKYTAGMCGTDETGLIEAENEHDACVQLQPDAAQHMDSFHDYDEDPDFDADSEADQYAELYDPVKHNDYLYGTEEGYIATRYNEELRVWEIGEDDDADDLSSEEQPLRIDGEK